MKKSLGAMALALPTPVWVIGTYDQNQKPNIMTASWGGVCCSKPPCVAVSLRKATYSYANIVQHQAFTVSIPSEKHVVEADFLGIASGKNTDKFKAVGLSPVASELVNAPYVREFPFVLECKVIHTIEIGLHTQFIGEIMDIKADEAVLGPEGLPDVSRIRPFVFFPEIVTYHAIGEYIGQAFSIGRQ